ncbi:ketoacyl-ACP synthase III [Blastopirellula sp. JC732]|uniref:Ketoacyl-ACP synthase III n=1 Tax=Blastopirellula sediminis TaxID=2894196 RepID=A0A9X1MTF2_9BACT|nr:ketoacyl-ACP synthase III [Blastopirellula sediminis]MCC9604626.1 ketoacyl-ACP synthase III [Blastopirellula sediminis]MCC9632075.1 ketoacyl-ACP synthase III [Blastopirellula sediminis]
MKYASIGPIAIHLPERIETNEQLQAEFPQWDMNLIAAKTGIDQRHVAAEGECASDLGVKAALRLFEEHAVDPKSIDFLLFCTQTPDYPLPTTACLMQDRLGLPTSCGALDFNLGCSGYIYGLAMADGLIRSGVARRVLLITAETYSKYIAPDDRSIRTIFGDGAAATLVEASDKQELYGFQFGTDGTGADTLLATEGGARPAEDAIQPRHRKRWSSRLYMDGPSLISFTVGAVPQLVENILAAASMDRQQLDLYLFHQATRKMLEQLQERMELDEKRMPIELSKYGNTVSATIPILIHDLRKQGRLEAHRKHVMVGFGVGWSWGGCIWRDPYGSKAYVESD